MASRVLIVEDERDIRDLVVLHLQRDGYQVSTAGSGEEALLQVKHSPPDLVLLDLMLPGMSGLEVCRRLRQEQATATLPILMLTAKADEVDRVVGLEMGADDYVVKPFSPKELVARVHALLRRSRPALESAPTTFGALTIDPGTHRASVEGKVVPLTPKEFDLLRALVEARGRVLSREFLLDRVWAYARSDEVESRTVDVHVRRLPREARRGGPAHPDREERGLSLRSGCGMTGRGLIHALRSRIALKLTLTLVGFVAVFLIAAGLYLSRALERVAIEVLESRLTVAGRVLHDEAVAGAQPAASAQALQRFMERATRATGMRVSLIAPDGRVLADSERPGSAVATMDNDANRPEVRGALEGRVGSSVRRSVTLDAPLIYVALPLTQGGRVMGVLRLAEPISAVTASYETLRSAALAGGAVALLVALGIGIFVAGRVTRPVVEMQDVPGR